MGINRLWAFWFLGFTLTLSAEVYAQVETRTVVGCRDHVTGNLVADALCEAHTPRPAETRACPPVSPGPGPIPPPPGPPPPPSGPGDCQWTGSLTCNISNNSCVQLGYQTNGFNCPFDPTGGEPIDPNQGAVMWTIGTPPLDTPPAPTFPGDTCGGCVDNISGGVNYLCLGSFQCVAATPPPPPPPPPSAGTCDCSYTCNDGTMGTLSGFADVMACTATVTGLCAMSATPGTCCVACAPLVCGPCVTSDIRLKENIVKVGNVNGFNVYEFRYREGYGLDASKRYIGVMAQEVMKVRPDAVVTMPNGYYGVRYDLIGVGFRAVE